MLPPESRWQHNTSLIFKLENVFSLAVYNYYIMQLSTADHNIQFVEQCTNKCPKNDISVISGVV